MTKTEKDIFNKYDYATVLLDSLDGKTLIGKLAKNDDKIRAAWKEKAETFLLEIIDIDNSSPYVEKLRTRLYPANKEYQ